MASAARKAGVGQRGGVARGLARTLEWYALGRISGSGSCIPVRFRFGSEVAVERRAFSPLGRGEGFLGGVGVLASGLCGARITERRAAVRTVVVERQIAFRICRLAGMRRLFAT